MLFRLHVVDFSSLKYAYFVHNTGLRLMRDDVLNYTMNRHKSNYAKPYAVVNKRKC